MYEILGVKWFCLGAMWIFVLIMLLNFLIPIYSKILKRRKMQVLSLLGTTICQICKAEVAKYSHSKDREAEILYCYECMIELENVRREALDYAHELKMYAEIFDGLFGSNVFNYTTSVKKSAKKKKVRRKA